MEENKRHIDDFLRDELGNYTETPPPAVWDALEKRLDEPTNRKGFDFRRLWWIIPVLLFITGGSFLAAHIWNQKPALPKQTAPVTDTLENSFGPAMNHRDTSAEQADTAATGPGEATPGQQGATDKTNTKGQVKTAVADNRPAGSSQDNSTTTTNNAIADNRKPKTNNTSVQAGKNTTTAHSGTHTSAANNQQAHSSTQNTGVNPALTHTQQQDNTPAGKTTGKQSAGKNKTAKQTSAAHNPDDNNAAHTNTGSNNTSANTSPITAKANSRKKSIAARSKAQTANDESKQPETVTPATETAKKTSPVKSEKATAKDKAAIKGNGNAPKNQQQETAAKEGKKTKQQLQQQTTSHKQTAIAKTETETSNKEQPGNNTTATSRNSKKNKQKPANTGIAAQLPKPGNTQSAAAPVSRAKDQEYTFKSRTTAQEPPKARENLDLSDVQARAEADTGSDNEMDPYASLNPPAEKERKKLEGGIKAAYTYGFNNFALNRISVLPYLQWNFSNKLSVALHLGFSYGQMKKTDLTGTQSYYNSNASMQTFSEIDSAQIDTFYTYAYQQTRDSFSVKYTTTKSLWEIELPLVLKYKLTNSLSVFGGPVFTLGKMVQITEDKSQTYSRTITDSVIHTQNQYTIAYFNNLHQPSGAPDSTYNNKPYQNPGSTPMRLGYTLGLSYDAGKHITADVSVQQMLTSPGFIPNETIQKVYTQPYIRVAIGFRLFGK